MACLVLEYLYYLILGLFSKFREQGVYTQGLAAVSRKTAAKVYCRGEQMPLFDFGVNCHGGQMSPRSNIAVVICLSDLMPFLALVVKCILSFGGQMCLSRKEYLACFAVSYLPQGFFPQCHLRVGGPRVWRMEFPIFEQK